MRRQGERPESIRWRLCGTSKTWSFGQRRMKMFWGFSLQVDGKRPPRGCGAGAGQTFVLGSCDQSGPQDSIAHRRVHLGKRPYLSVFGWHPAPLLYQNGHMARTHATAALLVFLVIPHGSYSQPAGRKRLLAWGDTLTAY